MPVEIERFLAACYDKPYETSSDPGIEWNSNYAVKMYEKAGFKTVDENEEEYIMAAELVTRE